MARNELETRLRPFLSENPPDTIEKMLQVLERYNAPWMWGAEAVRAIASNEPSKRIPDFVTSEQDPFAVPLPHLDRIPFLYRLHSLRQLSTVAVTTHFGATHTRFSHSVGTVWTANAMMTRLREPPFGDTSGLVAKALAALQEDVVRKACLVFCALHDAFHGPFGHSLDIMKDVFGAKASEKLDDKYLAEGLSAALSPDAEDPVGLQLRAAAEHWVGPEDARKLLDLVLLLMRKSQLLKEKPELYFLRQIVDSEIDADRFDYVIRDGLYLEQKNYRSDYAEVLATIRLVEWPSQHAASDGGDVGKKKRPRVCLAFATQAQDAVAQLLGKRGEYYTRYYETAEKLVVDDMICHALAYVFESKNVDDRPSSPSTAVSVAKLKRQIMMLTDETFIPALLELKASAECYELLFRYQQRRFFLVIKTIDVRLDELLPIRRAVVRWFAGVDGYLATKAEEAGVKLAAFQLTDDDINEAGTAFSDHFSRSVDAEVAEARRELKKQKLEEHVIASKLESIKQELVEKILGFGFQIWTHGVFRHRQAFERKVWDSLTSDGNKDSELAELAEREYGNAAHRTRFHRFPPIHVTSPSHFAMFDYHAVLRQRKESPYPVEEILFYDIDEPDAVREIPIKPSAKEDRPSYPLVLSAPQEIIDVFGVGKLSEAFVRELCALDWLVLRFSGP